MAEEAANASAVPEEPGAGAVGEPPEEGDEPGELGVDAARPNMTLMLSGRPFRSPPLLGKPQRWRHWASKAKAAKPVLVA